MKSWLKSPAAVGTVAIGVILAAFLGATTLMAARDLPVAAPSLTAGAQGAECTAAPEGSAPGDVTAVPGCKTCKDRPWCECRYNGYPRASCNPCCYTTPTGLICRD